MVSSIQPDQSFPLAAPAIVSIGGGGFIGAFVGMAGQYLDGRALLADFLEFRYRPL